MRQTLSHPRDAFVEQLEQQRDDHNEVEGAHKSRPFVDDQMCTQYAPDHLAKRHNEARCQEDRQDHQSTPTGDRIHQPGRKTRDEEEKEEPLDIQRRRYRADSCPLLYSGVTVPVRTVAAQAQLPGGSARQDRARYNNPPVGH
jgi:hypothetical protein